MRRSLLSVLAVPAVLFVLVSCAAYQNLAHPPKVTLSDVQLTGASLAGADLVFRFQVDNPNGRGMVLEGIGYKLRLNGEPMLEGRHDQRIEIAAGQSSVELPMTVGYADLLRVIRSLVSSSKSSSKPTYDLDAEFRFAVPILGSVTVPVTRRGVIPLDKVKLDLGQ
jgi:LEA14-like dessication related protein